MAAPAAGSAPAGEGEGSPAPKWPSRWRRGVTGFGAFVPGEGEGCLTFLGPRGPERFSGLDATLSCLGGHRRWPPPGSKLQHLTHARTHSATSPACVFSHPQFTHIPQAHLQKRLLRFPGRK